jgi:prepilin-type N-terminal cleavage/methylation domain-containing protein
MKKRGFTLIELMVVVVIIGILAAIAIPNFVRIVDKAKCASVKANEHTLQVAIEALSIAKEGRYPEGTSDINDISTELPPNFKNPYSATVSGTAAITFGAFAGNAADEGQVFYDSDASGSYTGTYYTICGGCKLGKTSDLTLRPGK